MNIADTIKRTLSMDEVVRMYDFEPNRSGNISCPFHSERTPSLHIYKEPGRGWHCFGCGEGGSVIDFVMLLFGIPFTAAVVRLNADFHLGLSNDRPDPKEAQKLREARRAAKKAAEAYEADYMAHTIEYRRMWAAKKYLAPTSPDSPIHPQYVEACMKLDALDWWFEIHPYKRGEQYQRI